jgi:hypothetical protein
VRRAALVAALAGALALGAGSAQAQAPVNPLAVMAVPRAQLGKAAQNLQVELLSGPTTNARAADDSFDPTDSAATVGKAGRVSGYTLVYGDVGFSGLRSGSGLIDVGTSLDIFRTQAKAHAYELKSLADLRRVRGMNLQGVVVERATPFPVQGLGPGAVGLRIVQRVGKKRIYGTAVDFQIDKILCEAVLNRADKTNVDAQAVAIARKLAERIVAYAQGSLKAQPPVLPRPLGTAKPPGKAPDLSAMVPTTADLKGKGGVYQQTFAPDDNAIGSYVREYRFGPDTGIYQLRATAALERSRREASGRVLVLRQVFTGPEAAATLAQIVGGAAPARLDGVRRPGLGDESFAVGATFTSQGQKLRAVILYERRDRILGSLVLVGTAKKLTLAAAMPYAKALDKITVPNPDPQDRGLHFMINVSKFF